MTTVKQTTALRGAEFLDVDLSGARFVGADLTGVVMRGVEAQHVEIDSAWLFDRDNVLLVNGVDVLPFVDAELDRRFPGRADRHAPDPQSLRVAWDSLQDAWAATLDRVVGMPAGTVDVSVDGEWSFAQTLRHLVLATDTWLRRGILRLEQPYHPLGLRDASADDEESTAPDASAEVPAYRDVLDARAGRVTMVDEFLAGVTADELADSRTNPHDPTHDETVLTCIHVILEEEWEHLRYAVRDLDAIAARSRREPDST